MLLSYLWKTFKLSAGIILVILFTRTFVVESGRVNGISMESTFHDNELFFVNKYALLFSEPKRWQVVQCWNPMDHSLVIKRVIGLPGETVEIHENSVFVTDTAGNRIALNESYLNADSITAPWRNDTGNYPVLGPDQYFVLGDNRRFSVDSRVYGPVPREDILGVVFSKR